MAKGLSNYRIFQDLVRNTCVKGKASLNLTDEDLASVLHDAEVNIEEIVGDVENWFTTY